MNEEPHATAATMGHARVHATANMRPQWSTASPRVLPHGGTFRLAAPADRLASRLAQPPETSAGHQPSPLAACASQQPTGSLWLRHRRGLCSSPPPSQTWATAHRSSSGNGVPTAAAGDARRPLAAWVRRFRQNPPLPREERLPYTLPYTRYSGDGGASTGVALQQELERSAEALLEEAQRAIACLDSAPGAVRLAGVPAAVAELAGMTTLRGSGPGSCVQDSPRWAASAPRRPDSLSAADFVGLEAGQGAKTCPAGPGRALETLAPHAVVQGTPAENMLRDFDDREDLLERWRRRKRAQEVCALLIPAFDTTQVDGSQ